MLYLLINLFIFGMLHSISSFSPPFSSLRGHQLSRNFPLSPSCWCLLRALGSGWIVRDLGEIQPLTFSPLSLVCRLATPSLCLFLSHFHLRECCPPALCLCGLSSFQVSRAERRTRSPPMWRHPQLLYVPLDPSSVLPAFFSCFFFIHIKQL